MSDTSVKTGPSGTPGPGPISVNAPETGPTQAPPATPPRTRPTPWPMKVVRTLASLRLTVVLFVLSLLLVFYGTLAQIDAGIWTVVNSYFRCFIAWIPLQLNLQFGQKFFWIPESWKLSGSVPFPGGYI